MAEIEIPEGQRQELPPEMEPSPEPGPEPEQRAQEARSSLELRREGLREFLQSDDPEVIRQAVMGYQPSEIAEVLDEEPIERQLIVIRALPPEQGLDIFDHFDPVVQAELLAEFREWRAARYLEEMSPDQRADLFGELPEELAAKFLKLLPPEERRDVQSLLRYDEHTAGGRMTTDFAWAHPDWKVAQVLEKLRRDFRDIEMIYYVYVLDDTRRLVGLLSLRYILLADPEALVRDIMVTSVIRVHDDVDQEIVAQELAIYDFVALPVVDSEDRMLGIVTFDDVVDVMESEAVEDQELFGGMSPSEGDYMDLTVWQSVKQRLPWLALFLLLSSGSTFILQAYEEGGYNVGFYAGVWVLLPMMMAMAGNAATQTATLVIRSLTIRDIRGRDVGRVIGRELMLGLAMGLILSILAFGRAWAASETSALTLGVAVALSMVVVLGLSTVIGASLPIVFESLKLDPAVMSSPFIATLIDIITVLIFFQISIFIWSFIGVG